MAEIVNLRLARKRKRRAEKERDARQNRLDHGRSGGQAALDQRARARELERLEGHRRDCPDDPQA